MLYITVTESNLVRDGDPNKYAASTVVIVKRRSQLLEVHSHSRWEAIGKLLCKYDEFFQSDARLTFENCHNPCKNPLMQR